MNKWLPAISLLVSFSFFSKAQDVVDFQKMSIGNSGCSFLFVDTKTVFDTSHSEDGSLIWTAESIAGDFNFGIICVKFLKPVDDTDQLVPLLTSYLDYLKTSWEITKPAEYVKGFKLESSPEAKGVGNIWEDKNDTYYIRGWVNENYLSVLYVYGEKECDLVTREKYFDSFRFAK